MATLYGEQKGNARGDAFLPLVVGGFPIMIEVVKRLFYARLRGER